MEARYCTGTNQIGHMHSLTPLGDPALFKSRVETKQLLIWRSATYHGYYQSIINEIHRCLIRALPFYQIMKSWRYFANSIASMSLN